MVVVLRSPYDHVAFNLFILVSWDFSLSIHLLLESLRAASYSAVMSTPQMLDSTGPLPVNEQKDVENQLNSETKRLEHPLLYDPTPPTVLVDFDGSDDPYLPMNWAFRKKVLTTFLYGCTTCWITFASAVYSTALGQVSEDFQVSSEVAASGVSLIVFGFGLGPLIWAPLSEVYGRKWVVIVVRTALLPPLYSEIGKSAKDP